MFVLINDLKNIRNDFDIQEIFCEPQPSWNITPAQSVPVILLKDKERVWRDSGVVDDTALLTFLKAYPADEMNYKSGIGSHTF